MARQTTKAKHIVTFLGSNLFFKGIVVFFVLQAAWIGLSASYPMAFDEDFHFGLIKLYAEHGSPFWSAHPVGGEVYGALTRDPSYLYHYLMSFPYRFINLFTDSQATQVLLLRGLNIAMLAASLAVWRRLLLKSGASKALVHICLLAFSLIPVVPMLAAHINYDNALIPLVGLILLWTVNFSKELENTKRINVRLLGLIIAVGLLTSLLKYAFLPIFLAIAGFIAWQIIRCYPNPRKLLVTLGFGVTLMTRRTRWLLLALITVAVGLCIERYGVNLVRYHTPVADCGQVLSIEQCQKYGPWARDHRLSSQQPDVSANPLKYADDWLDGMRGRLFFTLAGPTNEHETRGPLSLPFWGATFFAIVSSGLLVVCARRLWRLYERKALSLFVSVSVVYVAILFFNGFELYRRTGAPVAINGRYLLPILPILFLLSGLAWGQLLRRQQMKLAAAGLAITCLLWGGGALTFILRSRDHWYWDNHTVRVVNDGVRHSIGPLVPGYDRPTQHLP